MASAEATISYQQVIFNDTQVSHESLQ
jgi:hypothetical protein